MNKAAVLLATAALTAPLALGAQTLDLPPRKAGLWEVATTIERPMRMPAVTWRLCLDPATDREMMDFSLKLTDGKCRSITTSREGKSFVIDADCNFGDRLAKSRTVVSGDLQSAYAVRAEGTVDAGDGKGPLATLTSQAATWKSTDCPGMRPGDMSMSGGIRINIKQMKAFADVIR